MNTISSSRPLSHVAISGFLPALLAGAALLLASISNRLHWLDFRACLNALSLVCLTRNASLLTSHALQKTEDDCMAIQEGNLAPLFSLKDATGKTVSLKDFRGKQVIVYFYPRDNTPGCTKEACGFRDAWDEVQKQNVVVLGISPDSGASHEKFAAKHQLPFILLSDPDKTVMQQYDAFGEKVMYGKKTTGVMRSTVWIGPDGKVKKHWQRVVNAAEHPAQVLQALEKET
jgi:thioredoxin-dependent peroxiredoxin